MFELSTAIPLSEATVTSIISNFDNCICPLISEDVSTFSKAITIHNKISLLCTLYAKRLWENNIQKTNGFIYKTKSFGYEFSVSKKLQGTAIVQSKAPLTKQITASGSININIRVYVIDNMIHVNSYISDITGNQQRVELSTTDSGTLYCGDFLLESKKMQLNSDCHQRICKSLEKGFEMLKSELSNFEVKDGDILTAMYISNPKRFQSLADYRIIAHCYNAAIRKFPLFKKEYANSQKYILSYALKRAKQEMEFDGRKFLTYSDFSKALYFEIMANHLDYILIPQKHFMQELKMQNWGRSRKFSPTLLSSKEDFEAFDYSKVSPDNLIWVIYENQNYPAYEMFQLLNPSPEDIASARFESFILDNDDSSETFDDD